MSVEVKTPTRTQFEHTEFQCGDKQFGTSHANDGVRETQHGEHKRKLSLQTDYESHRNQDGPRFRKRRSSQFKSETSSHQSFGFRRKRLKSSPGDIILPTKFLLGGNITDPLNLNSMNDEEINRILNEKTPQSSPLPTPSHRQKVEVQIPTNITDPLNLSCGDDEGSLIKKKKKRKNKKKDDDSVNLSSTGFNESEKRRGLMEALKIDIDEDQEEEEISPSDTLNSKAEASDFSDKFPKPDKIVSPVIPQTSIERSRKRRRTQSMSDAVRPDVSSSIARSILRTSLSPPRPALDQEKTTPPKRCKRQNSQKSHTHKSSNNKSSKFIYGNYNRYYGYRNPETEEDHRIKCFKQEWFEGKDVLDIGCNVGHLTLEIAKDMHPQKIVGIDIDSNLICMARKNIRHYLSGSSSSSNFPISNILNYGPIAAPPVRGSSSKDLPKFPSNVAFIQGNYVLERDELLSLQKEEYDTILALSLTKWIHLNNGDAGLKRFFKRIFKQLRPGGHLILEPQPWSSYKKKKKLTPDIHKNFQSITLKPDQFSDYLLSKEVGFSTCEVVDLPFNKSKGFRRPIQLFTKAVTAVNSPKQDHTSVDSPKQDHTSVDSPKQDHAAVDSPKQDHTAVDSPKQYHTSVDSPKQDHTSVDSSKQDHTSVDSSKQDYKSVDSPKQDQTAVSSSKQDQ